MNKLAVNESKLKVLLIIPAYNEASSIKSVVDGVIAFGFDYVVIDDGSRDNTLEVCISAGFNVVHLSRNLGIGGAVQTGYRYASERNYDIAIQFDGDGQHDLASIPTLIEKVGQGFDLVIGSRFISEENEFFTTPLRRVGIRWLRALIKLCASVNVSDPTSGFRACNAHAIGLFANDYPLDYPEPESIALASRKGLKIAEVPAVMHERTGGKSSIGGLSSLYYMMKVSLAILISGRFGSKGD